MSSFSCAGPVQLVGTLGEKRFSVVQSMQGQPCCSGRLAVEVQLFNIPRTLFRTTFAHLGKDALSVNTGHHLHTHKGRTEVAVSPSSSLLPKFATRVGPGDGPVAQRSKQTA